MSLEDQVDEFLGLIKAMGRKNSLRDPLANLIAEQGLGPAQVHALMWLAEDGPLTMGVLAQRCGITEKTITGVVDRLEREGYVARERNAEDRRVVRCVLTESGQSFAGALQRGIQHNAAGFLGLLDAQDRGDLLRIMKNLAAKLEAHSSERPVGQPPSPKALP